MLATALDRARVTLRDLAGALGMRRAPQRRKVVPIRLNRAVESSLPLILHDHRIVVSWAPKSACTHVVMWAFHHMGLLEEALAFDPWPHNYRTRVLKFDRKSIAATKALLAAEGKGYTLIKVVRDPHKRLVSVFRHVCLYRFLRPLVADKTGINPVRQGISLRDLDATLSGECTTNPSDIDPHVLAQYHPWWDMPFDRVITLNIDQNDMDQGLNAIERDLGLPVTDLKAIADARDVLGRHYNKGEILPRGATSLESFRFKPKQAARIPKAALLELPLLDDMVRRYYSADFGRVDSGDTAGRLFQTPGA